MLQIRILLGRKAWVSLDRYQPRTKMGPQVKYDLRLALREQTGRLCCCDRIRMSNCKACDIIDLYGVAGRTPHQDPLFLCSYAQTGRMQNPTSGAPRTYLLRDIVCSDSFIHSSSLQSPTPPCQDVMGHLRLLNGIERGQARGPEYKSRGDHLESNKATNTLHQFLHLHSSIIIHPRKIVNL